MPVTPVFKRVIPSMWTLPDPLPFPQPMMCLFAVVLNARLMELAGCKNLCAHTQSGSRPELSTLCDIFALQHLVDGAPAHG